MFSLSDGNDYDFEKSENLAKWKGVLIPSLKKVSIIFFFFGVFLLYIFGLIVFVCVLLRFSNKFILHSQHETMLYYMLKVFVSDCWQCFAENHLHTRSRFDKKATKLSDTNYVLTNLNFYRMLRKRWDEHFQRQLISGR